MDVAGRKAYVDCKVASNDTAPNSSMLVVDSDSGCCRLRWLDRCS